MLTRKYQADGIAKQHFGQEVFDLCWTSGSKPMSMTLAKPHYGGQTFDMCWTAQTDLVPVVNALVKEPTVKAMAEALIVKAPAKALMIQATTNASMIQATTDTSMIQAMAAALTVQATAEASLAKPLYGGQGKFSFDICWDADTTPTEGQYNLCWDEPSSSKTLSVAAIMAEAATLLQLAATSYNICWGEEPPQPTTGHASLPSTASIPAVEYQGGFDMCWGDSSVGDSLHAVHPTTLTNAGLVSSALSKGSAIAITRVKAGEELVTQADERLHRMDAMMGLKKVAG
ncbi:hypothetical protein BDR04DRAFT_1122711 [Suillus decipiens]|nr:hypothetical protein BDR04DRAFT_1122711 [Suillus decipiens]